MRNVFVQKKVSMGDVEHSVYLKIFDYKRVGYRCILKLLNRPIYQRVGDVSILKLFNFSIYKSVGDVHKLFFWVWVR